MRRFVIDTSLFVNPQARKSFGKTPKDAVIGFLKKIKGLKAEFYMPTSVFKELGTFVDEKTIEKLEMVVKRKSPNLYTIYIPAAVFFEFVEDLRGRINKGLRVAEEFAKDNAPNNKEKITKLREKFRAVMRKGIVDSKEDLELILLAKELDATLITSDEGMIKFADAVGCEWLNAEKFYKLIQSLKKKK